MVENPISNTTAESTANIALESSVTVPAIETPVLTTTVEVPVATAEPVTKTEEFSTVLGDALKPEVSVEKPTTVETPKESTETQPTDVTETPKVESEPAPAPVYDPFKLPDDLKLDDTKVKEFTDILSDLETKSKAEHALVQEFGQKAVDFHINEIKKTVNDLQDFYKTAWDKQKTDWKDDFLKDPNIGGNRFQTTVDSANNFIRTHGGTSEEITEFRNLMETSGLGNHKAVIRLLANAGRAMSEGQPLAATAPVTQTKTSKVETLYGKSK